MTVLLLVPMALHALLRTASLATSTACGGGDHGSCTGTVWILSRGEGQGTWEDCDCTCHSRR